MEPAAKIGPILKLLEEHYPKVHVTLDFTNPLELLVATILSAQCTDERVNKVTPALFKKYPTAADYGRAPLEELEQAIYQTGFYHNKAKSLKGLGQALVEKYGGQVPASLEELVQAPRHRPQDRQRRPGQRLRHPRHRGGYPLRPGVPAPGPDPRQGPGEDRVRPDAPGAEGALDQILPATHLARPGHLHRQKPQVPQLSPVALLRLRPEGDGVANCSRRL